MKPTTILLALAVVAVTARLLRKRHAAPPPQPDECRYTSPTGRVCGLAAHARVHVCIPQHVGLPHPDISCHRYVSADDSDIVGMPTTGRWLALSTYGDPRNSWTVRPGGIVELAPTSQN